ncbi:hypothetical protein JCM8547_008426 [Rhodosporidiobolus lusitaniae]
MDDPYSTQSFDHPSMSTSVAYPSIPAHSLSAEPTYVAPSYHAPPPFLRNDSAVSGGSGSDSSGELYRAASGYAYSTPPQPSPQQYGQVQQFQQQQPEYGMAQPPASAAPSGSAAMLLQQHQANQQAFRSGQAANAQIFQTNQVAANQGDLTASGSGSHANSRESSAGGSSNSTSQSGGGGTNGDGDFTQTFYDPFRIKHRRRTSPPQLKILEFHFEKNPKPDVTLRKALSEQLDMTPREVQVWFQNRRAKVKKLREKAECEAAAAAVSGDQNVDMTSALNAPASELPIPPPFIHAAPQSRTIYGQDAMALRRGSSPAIFGGGSYGLPQPPVPVDHFQPFQPYQAAPLPNQPFSNGTNAYPSPASLSISSATPSPNDFLAQSEHAQPPPLGVPSYLANEIAAGPGRRFSLPVYNSLYAPDAPSQPLQMAMQQPVSHPPPHFYGSSAPVESSYLDQQLQPAAPLPAQIDALSLGVDPSFDTHSPASSLGEPVASWDGHAQPFALDGFSDGGHAVAPRLYAPPVPSQLSRRASCPTGPAMYAQQQHQQDQQLSFEPYGQHQEQQLVSPPQQPQQQHIPPHQRQASWNELDSAPPAAPLSNGQPSLFFGYSLSGSPASTSAQAAPPSFSTYTSPSLATGAPPYSRRGSLAQPPSSLGTIAEQPPQHAFDAALAANGLSQHGSSTSPSPPSSQAASERRGSVIRRARSTNGSLHSPYAAAAQERYEGGEGAGL